MTPNDEEPKRVIPAVGTVTTYLYEGPMTRARKSGSTERLELIDGKTRPVTYIYEGQECRLKTE